MADARLLYVYPEEWTRTRAREIQVLGTCIALARLGARVTLVTAGGADPRAHAPALGHPDWPSSLEHVALPRTLGPLRSIRVFARRLARWLARAGRPDVAYIRHPKAAPLLARLGIPYWYEAQEVFAESAAPGTARLARLERMEGGALAGARGRVATCVAMAAALNERYFRDAPRPFAIVPNAGGPPLDRSVADPTGPLAYAGSLADWKGLPLALEAAARCGLPVRVVGGGEGEWARLAARLTPAARAGVEWRPRVPLAALPDALAGTRAGLIPTDIGSGSGHYSCPLKLFDYARFGLPVVITDLPSLPDLEMGPWCTRVATPSVEGWAQALAALPPGGAGDAPREWAARHTWDVRARALLDLIGR